MFLNIGGILVNIGFIWYFVEVFNWGVVGFVWVILIGNLIFVLLMILDLFISCWYMRLKLSVFVFKKKILKEIWLFVYFVIVLYFVIFLGFLIINLFVLS